ncbi:MAG: hypothetical protein HC913_01925 [Microscillaceae bacterium]|nr:hypothetical protein [Microscillaceae bacterium]
MNSLTCLVDLYKCYEVLKEESVIFSHQGALDGEMIDIIIQLADKKLVKANARVRIKKKIINILVECLQNSYHYTASLPNEADWLMIIESPYVIVSYREDAYYILTGNLITRERAEALKKRIDEITRLDDEGLQEHYIRSLDKDELPKQGGAGLGLIDIMRRAHHRVSFSFEEVDEKLSRFSMLIKVV